MRLTQFIQENRAKIIDEWIAFASTLLPWAKGMSLKGLQDHAEELLAAVITDMEAPQSDDQQAKKSKGRTSSGALASVGHKHATQRLGSGFNLEQLVSEYRALRASILRLWCEAEGDKARELTRFNEAIDESLTEATLHYSQMLEHTREQFLAILGHDLRNPLSAIVMGATVLTAADSLDDTQARIATRILSSAGRMDRMVHDLLDLTRTRLGSGIPIKPTHMDLAPVFHQVIAELEAVYPDCDLQCELKGDLSGEWDCDRLNQVITNLVANALQYGGKHGPVRVVGDEHGNEVELRVHNEGPAIAESALKTIFEPMTRQPSRGHDANATGLGLGLYIAREVVTAHGGTVVATSTKRKGTTFTVRLPRHPPARDPGGHMRRSTDAKPRASDKN